MLKTHRAFFLLGCATALPLTFSPPVRADLTVTSETRIMRSSDPAQNQIGETRPEETRGNVVSYRGDLARVEQGDGTITLYDLKAGRVYLLTPADKTYSTLSLGDFLKRDLLTAPQDAAGRAANSNTEVRLDLKKDAVIESKTLAGFQTQAYDLTGGVTVSFNRPAGGGRSGFPGGGRRGRRGGGFPGGYPVPDSGGRGAAPVRVAQFEGEVWLSAPNALKTKTKISLLPLLQLSVPSARLMQPLADKIAKIKGFPLSGKVIFAGRNAPSAASASSSVTVSFTVKTIVEGPLDESLFMIPADYQRLAAR